MTVSASFLRRIFGDRNTLNPRTGQPARAFRNDRPACEVLEGRVVMSHGGFGPAGAGGSILGSLANAGVVIGPGFGDMLGPGLGHVGLSQT
jgi:hypothetical protein